jgi:molybdopterin-guanine dinucleotide biosynthesis protein A
MKLSIVIQAGGDSHRMGTNKALLPFMGQTLIERVISRVQDLADELLITSNRPEDLEFLGIPTFPDVIQGRGALGGILTALTVANHPAVAVIACDMPFVNPGLLCWQLQLLEKLNCDGVVPSHAAGYEPFHSVYRRNPCLKAVEKSLDLGKKRADAWFQDVHLEFISHDQVKTFDPNGIAFLNINNEDDYQHALGLNLGMGISETPNWDIKKGSTGKWWELFSP